MRHLDSVERLGQGADLVELDEHGIGGAELDALLDALNVRDKQIVADELDLLSKAVHEHLPAFPVILGHAVLEGDDRVLLHEVGIHVDHLLAGHDDAALRQMIAAVLGVEPLGAGTVDGNHEIVIRLVAGQLDGLDERLERVLVAVEVRRIAALVAHAGGRDDLLEHVEHFRAHAQRLGEALGADGHDHELLNIDVAAGGVRAAVEHVHHRHRKGLGIAATDVVIQALAGRQRAGLRAREGHAEDGVGAETGLVRRAVELDEELVDRGLVKDVHALQRLCDLDVHVLHGLEHALAEVTALVAVAQLAGLVDTGGSAGGNGRAADGAVVERDFHFHGRVAAGVENFSGADVHNFKIILHVHTPL